MTLRRTPPERTQADLASIPGVGVATAAPVAGMPEPGRMDAEQAASPAGLAPVARRSGTWRGKGAVRGGRAHLRQALRMPALVAARSDPDLKARFAAMTASGKPANVATTALMRRRVVLANALPRDNRPGPKPPLDRNGYPWRLFLRTTLSGRPVPVRRTSL